jgi:hypothetical protein
MSGPTLAEWSIGLARTPSGCRLCDTLISVRTNDFVGGPISLTPWLDVRLGGVERCGAR